MSEQPTRQSSEPVPTPGAARAHVVRCHGIKMRYLEWPGPAHSSQPPVLLLHGVLQTSEGMANVAEHLARFGRVIAPDLRGRGGTDQPASGYDPATLASDIASLIATIRLERPVVIGRMHGGLVAYYLAARHPQLIGGLVIGDTPPEVSSERAATIFAVVRDFPQRFATIDNAITYYQETLKLSEARARHDIPHDLVEEDGGWRWRHNLGLVAQIEHASMPRAEWDTLRRIACPSLVVRGQRGEITAAMAEQIAATIPQCQVTTIIGARHDVFLGPGCEQTFGAIDLFLMRLGNNSNGVSPAPHPARTGTTRGNHQATTPADVVERLVTAINQRDRAALEAVFASTVRTVQFGEGGKVREGGRDAARAAFGRVTSGNSNSTIAVKDAVANGDQVACVFTIWNPGLVAKRRIHQPEQRATLIPAFLRVDGGKIIELTTYHLHVPLSQADDLPPTLP